MVLHRRHLQRLSVHCAAVPCVSAAVAATSATLAAVTVAAATIAARGATAISIATRPIATATAIPVAATRTHRWRSGHKRRGLPRPASIQLRRHCNLA